MFRVAVVSFPGSNCDLDVLQVLRSIGEVESDLVWHEYLHDGYDAYILPGGFSYGDYLRAGAIAAKSSSMKTVQTAADDGRPVLGICNGFQILVEAGILPGSVLRNSNLRFICKWIRLRIENNRTFFTNLFAQGQTLRIPIAHNEGRYHLDTEELAKLVANGQVVMRYVDSDGQPTENANPNGSLDNIAGICNPKGNVMGLMPHPERASIPILSESGSTDGLAMFASMIRSIQEL